MKSSREVRILNVSTELLSPSSTKDTELYKQLPEASDLEIQKSKINALSNASNGQMGNLVN